MAKYYKSIATLWNDATSWSATSSSGVDNAGIPASTDDVIFDSGSGSVCAISTTTAVCKTLNARVTAPTQYTGTITLNVGITISGSLTLSSAMGFAGTGSLTINATSTLTSNGLVLSRPLTLSGTFTCTLGDDWTIDATLTFSTGNLTITSHSFTCKRDLQISTNVSGSAQMILTGAGTGTSIWTHSNGSCSLTIVINCGSNTFSYVGAASLGNNFQGTFSYVSGALGTFTNLMNIGGNTSFNWNGSTTYIPLPIQITSVGSTFNLLSDVYLTRFVAVNSAYGVNISFYSPPYYVLYVSGDVYLTLGYSSSTPPTIVLTGTGVLDGSLSGNIEINTSGTITIGGSVFHDFRIGQGTFTYVSGTVIISPYPIHLNPNLTMVNIGSIDWGDAIFSASTYTFNGGNFIATGTITLNGSSCAFNGDSGFTLGNITMPSTGYTITLKNGNIYNVKNTFSCIGSFVSRNIIKSDSTGLVAYLNLQSSCYSILSFYCDATDIDSSGGQPIYQYGGVISASTVNWKTITNFQYEQKSNIFFY